VTPFKLILRHAQGERLSEAMKEALRYRMQRV
jgi:hypothetical protein